MADHDVFENGVVDGDTISDGWINGAYDSVKDTTTGHDHDGTDSKQIKDMDSSGATVTFNTTTGHDHDGTSSKFVGITTKTITDATEYSHTGNTNYTTKISSTLTAGVGGILLGAYATFELYISDGSVTQGKCHININGVNLGDFYIDSGAASSNLTSFLHTSSVIPDMAVTSTTGYLTFEISGGLYLKLLDATTNIHIKIKTTSAGETVKIKNVELVLVYASSTDTKEQ